MNDFITLSQLIFFQSQRFKNARVLNYKDKSGIWRVFSNQEFLQKSFYFACALKKSGFKKGQTFANYSYQSPIWLIVDFGVILAGGVSVPIFYNISKENLFYQIDDAACDFIFVDDEQNFLNCKEKNIKNIICLKSFESGFSSFEEVLKFGEEIAKKYDINEFVANAKPQDLATIIYTSGSTGRPKGVELTHDNLVFQIKSTQKCFPLSVNDKALSFLPLAHIFERMVMMFYVMQGIEIYFVDDVKNLGNLLQETKPTLMTVVPRMLEKTFAKIKEKIDGAGFFAKILGRAALNRALTKDVDMYSKTYSKTYLKTYLFKYFNKIIDKFFDILVYKKFRKALGGNMKMLICGGAPLSNDMERFFRNIGINLYCGYGLTETSPVLAVNYKDNYKFATVGKIFPEVKLKIANDGELLAAGRGVMLGYHNLSEKNHESFVDGWFKTGDLAQIDEDGFVKIVGRKKELFKTATGKYVRPVPIEQMLLQELGFAIGVLIIAEGKKFVSSLIFPDFELIGKFKNKFNFDGDDEEFVKSESLKKYVENVVERVNSRLDHSEQIRKFAIISGKISIETGEITPSMKLKRGFLEGKYNDVVAGFYRE